VDRRSSTFSILSETSPVLLKRWVISPSSLIRRSRSFSCSLRTLMMKSRASRASSFVGFLDIFPSSYMLRLIE